MYVFIYVCMYIHTCKYIHIYTYMYIHIYICIYVLVYIYIYIYKHWKRLRIRATCLGVGGHALMRVRVLVREAETEQEIPLRAGAESRVSTVFVLLYQ
jgi:hypothetical protein